MPNTIFDIIQTGNLELFHSSMIAWLFDHNGEHGLNNTVLGRVAERLTKLGQPELQRALSEGNPAVSTELRRGRHRFDICVSLGEIDVVFENKTKSVGNITQLKQYNAPGALIVALGLCDESYSVAVRESYPLITYADVLSGLDDSNIRTVRSGPYRTLLQQYVHYLKRELHIIELVRNLVVDPQRIDRQHLAEMVNQPRYGENDRRFWNLILLERFRRVLAEKQTWRDTCWQMNKNNRSGVWLKGNFLSNNQIRIPLQHCAEEFGAQMWFHVELKASALSAINDDDIVGVLQLRARTEGNNREFADALLHEYQPGDNTFGPIRINPRANTFFVVGQHLRNRDLIGTGVPSALTKFAQTFQ